MDDPSNDTLEGEIILTKILNNGVTANIVYPDGAWISVTFPSEESAQLFAVSVGMSYRRGPGVE